jgi:hypothetical protein
LPKSEPIGDEPRLDDFPVREAVDTNLIKRDPGACGWQNSAGQRKLAGTGPGSRPAAHHTIILGQLLLKQDVQVGQCCPQASRLVFNRLCPDQRRSSRPMTHMVLTQDFVGDVEVPSPKDLFI